MDFVDIKENPMVIQTRSLHPNAAKLVAIYLVSPDGMKFIVERVQGSGIYYPGNYKYDSVVQAKKAGIPVYGSADYPGLLDFILSPPFGGWEKEIEPILRGG